MLQTDRLLLRNYVSADWERVHLYAQDADFSRFELWGPNSEADTKKFISEVDGQSADGKRHKFDLAFCLRESGLLIGGGGIRREGEKSAVANLGWMIHPDFQGRGFATEAARALVEFGFSQLGLLVIYATCDTRNEASFRVMEKIGMERVGFMKGDKMQKGYLRDSYRYEIKRE